MYTDRQTRVGIACRTAPDAVVSGAALVREAMSSGNIEKPDHVFAFCSSSVGPLSFFNGIQEVVGKEVPVTGGSAIGVISNHFLSYQNQTAGVMVVQSDSIKFRVKAAGGLGKGETETGERLAEALSREPEDKLFLIFYDSIKNPPTPDSPPMMNASSSLLRGIDRVLEQVVPVVGAGLVGDYDMGPTVQFCGASPESQHAVGVMVSGNVCAYHRIMHGCMPLDGIYRTITCIEGPILRGLDGRPVVETVNEMFGSDEWQKEHPVDFLTIGVNCGDRYATRFQEGDYVNRLIVGVTPDKSGVVMFEPDLAEGTEIQFMVRDTERMTESARENTERLMETLHADKKRPLFGIYIDCAGRAGAYSHRTTEEASEVQKVLNHHNIPFLGFYSGVEIAPLLGKSRGLDWTGVLIILAEDSEIGGKKI